MRGCCTPASAKSTLRRRWPVGSRNCAARQRRQRWWSISAPRAAGQWPAHTLVACNRFSQRDMDASGFGFPAGVTPFDATPRVLEFPQTFAQLPQKHCSTADSFATHLHAIDGDVVDMEAFALAQVCVQEAVAFALREIHYRRRRQRFGGALGSGPRRGIARLHRVCTPRWRWRDERSRASTDTQLRDARGAHDCRAGARARGSVASLRPGVFAHAIVAGRAVRKACAAHARNRLRQWRTPGISRPCASRIATTSASKCIGPVSAIF